MRKIIILGTYPSTGISKIVLSECIEHLTNSGYDLMIVSHLPIPKHIQSSVDYCFYDKKNPLLSYNQTPFWDFFSTDFHVTIYSEGHTVAVASNIMNGIDMATCMNYDFFYYMEADNLISKADLTKMDTLRDAMFVANKSLILFNPIDDDYTSYETLLFGGIPQYFSNYSKLPRTIDQLEQFNVSLERILYYNLHAYEQSFIVIRGSSKKYFDTSRINVISHEYIVEVIGVEGYNSLILWIQNHPSNLNLIKIKVGESPEVELMPDTWTFLFVTDKEIRVRITEGDQISYKSFDLTPENKELYRKKGTLTFK